MCISTLGVVYCSIFNIYLQVPSITARLYRRDRDFSEIILIIPVQEIGYSSFDTILLSVSNHNSCGNFSMIGFIICHLEYN